VTLQRLPNLRELTLAGRVERRLLITRLEAECRNADANAVRSAAGTVLERLNRWRELYQSCFMFGAPPKSAVKLAERPASEEPLGLADEERDELSGEDQAEQSLEQPKKDDVPYSARRAQRLAGPTTLQSVKNSAPGSMRNATRDS
jgi:hypothetical protein